MTQRGGYSWAAGFAWAVGSVFLATAGLAVAQESQENQENQESQENNDDWETVGPVDRTPRLSGALMASYRATYFDEHTLPDASRVEDSNTFQLEHTHIKLSGDLSGKLSWEVTPCLTHMNDFSVLTAYFIYELWPVLQVTAGRFLLPFGQFNLRSLPGTFSTVSRPLLYLSHDDAPIRFAQAPTAGANFIFTPRDDTGVLLSGNLWLGHNDVFQLSYSAYVTNGLRAVSDQAARFWNDNNTRKQLGGRASASYNGNRVTVGVGGSLLDNRYEEKLDQRAWAVDAVVSYEVMTARRITLRGEFVDMTREIQPTNELTQGDEGLRGAYVTAEIDITDALGIFYQWDTLEQRTPHAQLNEGFRDVEVTVNRHAAGVGVTFADFVEVRGEYSLWLEPAGLPDAHRLAVQTIVSF